MVMKNMFQQVKSPLVIVGIILGAALLILTISWYKRSATLYSVDPVQPKIDESLTRAPSPVTTTSSNEFPNAITPAPQITKSSDSMRWESTFAFPYYLSWRDPGQRGVYPITWTLTKITLGEEAVPPDPAIQYTDTNQFWKKQSGEKYRVGELVNAMTFYFKMTSEDSPPFSGSTPTITLRRVLDEEGNMASPVTTWIYFSEVGSIGLRPNETYYDKPVVFSVPKGETEFLFTTGGTTNIFFFVKAMPDGTVKVEKVPTSE
jgi:hypothetical protein